MLNVREGKGISPKHFYTRWAFNDEGGDPLMLDYMPTSVYDYNPTSVYGYNRNHGSFFSDVVTQFQRSIEYVSNLT